MESLRSPVENAMEGFDRRGLPAAASWMRRLGVAAFWLCLFCQQPFADADSLALESIDQRPRWTFWNEFRLPGLGLAHRDIDFAEDGRRGWIVGEGGAILTTSDGGDAWTPQGSGVEDRLFAIHPGTTKGRAWIAGSNGVILGTVDGGAVWTRQDSGVEGRLYAIHGATDDRRIWAVGANGAIVFSRDLGASWIRQDSGVDVDLRGVHVGESMGHAWVVGRGGLILRTENDGQTWKAQETGTSETLTSIHFSSDGLHGLAAGRNGVVVSSGDGGETWTTRHTQVYTDLYAVRLSADGNRGWVAGGGGVLLVTDDNGSNWELRSSGTNKSLLGIYLSDDGWHGWVVGLRGVLLSTDDGGTRWTVRRKGMRRRPWRLHAAHLSADGVHGWVAGDRGVVLSSDDGGATWAPQDTGSCEAFYGLHMSRDNRHGWAVGRLGTIVATQDGGRTWRPQLVSTAAKLNSVSMVDGGSRGWAVGDCGSVFATADGGATWTKVDISSDIDLASVHAAGEGSRAWAVGDDGAIVATVNDGKTWFPQHSRTDRDLRSVHFPTGSERGWAAGDDGIILVTEDGGARWIKQAAGTDNGIEDIHFSGDGRRGWAVGDYGTVLVTEDAGDSWELRTTDSQEDLTSIHVSREGLHAWIVGRKGTILATSDGGRNWTDHSITTRFDLVATYFSDNNLDGWAISDDGVVVVTSDGGKNFRLSEELGSGPNAVHVASDGLLGWAVGNRGTILATKDGWQTWTRPMGAMDFHLNAVHGAADNQRVWVATDDGRIIATADGGNTWFLQYGGADRELNAIHVSADGEFGWVAGDGGTIVATSDGGNAWSPQYSGTDRDLNAIHLAADGQRGWIVGRGGTILATGDGGSNWTVKDSGIAGALNAIEMVADGRHGWAVGRHGIVLGTADGGDSWVRVPVQAELDLNAVEVVQVGQAFRGWAVGKRNEMLAAGDSNRTPYLASFEAATRPGGNVLLEFAAKDDEGDSIDIAKVEMCKHPRSKPLCEALDLKKLVRNDNKWHLAWNPRSTSIYEVNPGDQLTFRVTVHDDKGGFSYSHATSAPWSYRIWYLEIWNRHARSVIAILSILAVYCLYVLAVLAIFLFDPVSLVRISRFFSGEERLNSLSLRPARILFHLFLTAAWFRLACHPRTRRAWIRRYDDSGARIADLPPGIRSRYLEDAEVLDAWVEKRATGARDAIASRNTIRSRAFTVDMPVRLDSGDQFALAASKTEIVSMIRGVLGRQRGVMAICGPPGSGKTTLAARIARWACSEDREEWMLPYRAVPVWVESETTDLVEDVTRELREMVGVDEVDRDTIRALLVNRRVLVIVDGLSERTRAMQEHVCGIYKTEVPINALVLTAREKPKMERLPVAVPRLIDGADVFSFIRRYALCAHQQAELSERTQLRIADRALDIFERRGKKVPMTPLLVTMLVDSAVKRFSRNGGPQPQELADSYPQLIVDYLVRVNPQAEDAPDRLDNEFMIRAAKALSRAALEPDFLPKELAGEAAVATLNEANRRHFGSSGAMGSDAESVIRRLMGNDLVERRSRGGTRFFRIRLDPVAEYLAAIDWTEGNGPRNPDWDALLETLEADDFAGQGFLVALFDAVATYGDDFAVPARVTKRLESLVPDAAGPEG